LSHPLNAFSIKPSYHCQIRLEVDSKLEEQVFLKLFELDPPYRLAVCASHPNLPESLISCSVKEIISSFAK
jgi:4'-phosphopantetheinyl transferase